MRTISCSCLALALAASLLGAQGVRAPITIEPPSQLQGRRGKVVDAPIRIRLQSGFHVNSNAPAEEYLIPLQFTSESGPAFLLEVQYPKPELQRYSFSERPLSVYTGDFQILARYEVLRNAPLGFSMLKGKLRYQACNDKLCLPPRTVEVRIPLEVLP